jgi:hypothetical protein
MTEFMKEQVEAVRELLKERFENALQDIREGRFREFNWCLKYIDEMTNQGVDMSGASADLSSAWEVGANRSK